MTPFQVKFRFSMSILLLLISLISVLGAEQKSNPPIGQDPKCLQPMEMGPCRMKLDRFYYNAKTNTCDQFKFGGCRGNDNKFGFKKTCEDACLLKSPSASKSSSAAASQPLPSSSSSQVSTASKPLPTSQSSLASKSSQPLPASQSSPTSKPAQPLPASQSSPKNSPASKPLQPSSKTQPIQSSS